MSRIPATSQDRPVLAVTPGEPAGIGPEILLKLSAAQPDYRLIAVADPALLYEAARETGIPAEIREWAPGVQIEHGVIACSPVRLARPAVPGTLDPGNAGYVLDTLRTAVRLVRDGHADALVTGPVHKGVINDGGFRFSGHTEFLANLAGVAQVVMMLAAPGLRVVLVTTHLPLRDVADAVTAEKLESVLRITERELRLRFGIDRPRLQVLGLNPHAGEGGHLGREEVDVLEPVIRRLQKEGFRLDGPVPADTAFNPQRLEACDAVVAMYHDQGLPVLKHVGFGRAVNVTLGLPFIRTSVDHGTALDLAGQGRADAGSLLEAVIQAERMAGNAPLGGPP
ncbi:MAG: 4-hydroxythreonine-4-phosphate dehydrogenase PdxA [Xanthomonadales bacterium]|nr:4-hydroxythreonine-4-phosphate dehydrogenase PdxA [Xanthomonadales bacterium]